MQFGHFFPDPQYENVQHIICCDSYATYAYDFEFANDVGFSRCYVYPFGDFVCFACISDLFNSQLLNELLILILIYVMEYATINISVVKRNVEKNLQVYVKYIPAC